jgi:nickel/cobalt exporter
LLPILSGALILSILHALIPSHWLPVLVVGREQGWEPWRILWVTLWAGTAHVASTVIFGVVLAILGRSLSGQVEAFSAWVAPGILIIWGVIYVYRHYRHQHFHLSHASDRGLIVMSLLIAMFFSPCLEIEGYFIAAGHYGWYFVLTLALLYSVVTLAGMMIWMRLALSGLKQLDWHAWEHNAGLVTGIILIFSGVLLFVLE